MKVDYEAHDPDIVAYLAKVKEISSMFKKFKIEHVPWSKNCEADALAKLTSSSSNRHPKSINWEILQEQMIDAKELVRIGRSKTRMEPLWDICVMKP